MLYSRSIGDIQEVELKGETKEIQLDIEIYRDNMHARNFYKN